MDDGFGLWDVLVSMLWFGLLMTWIWMIISILGDIFRDRELSGAKKALWTAFIVLTPWLGALCYILVRGDSMNKRAQQAALDQQARMREYIGAPAAEKNVADELHRLVELRDSGVLTPAEYDMAKAKVLA